MGLYYLYSETKVLISCGVTAQLVCTFVSAFANWRFSHDAAHLSLEEVITITERIMTIQ